MQKNGHELTEIIQKQAVASLVDQPINNDRYIATFHQESAYSGKVIFWSKKNDKTAEAQWRVYKEDSNVMAALTYNGFLLLDEEIKNFRECVSRKLLVF